MQNFQNPGSPFLLRSLHYAAGVQIFRQFKDIFRVMQGCQLKAMMLKTQLLFIVFCVK